jgi:hypothetical protein
MGLFAFVELPLAIPRRFAGGKLRASTIRKLGWEEPVLAIGMSHFCHKWLPVLIFLGLKSHPMHQFAMRAK